MPKNYGEFLWAVKLEAEDKPHAISVKWGATGTPASKAPAPAEHKMDPKMKM